MVEVLRNCWILDVLKIEVTGLHGWIRRVKCGSKVFVLHSPKRELPYSEKKEVAGRGNNPVVANSSVWISSLKCLLCVKLEVSAW